VAFGHLLAHPRQRRTRGDAQQDRDGGGKSHAHPGARVSESHRRTRERDQRRTDDGMRDWMPP
jgi:hypothetical protein